MPIPDGVTLRQVTDEPDVRAMSAMQDEVFGEPVSDEMADALLRRLSLGDGMQLWVAEAEGRMVTRHRQDPHAQRLHGILEANPGALRTDESFDDNPVPLDKLGGLKAPTGWTAVHVVGNREAAARQ